ncbi:MAG: hypothetical protein ACI9C1_001514 [Candidatus Aldehydirespiratoraceae bacterium]|jgi:hypothetical protein
MARNSATIWKAVAQAVDPPETKAENATKPGSTTAESPAGGTTAEPGQMMVPIDTWTRILEQVGNVHESGQQLADAKERAARAETENEFLKEQLRDLKSQKKTPRRPAAPATPAAVSKPAPVDEMPSTPRAQAVERLTRARKRASRWLSPE